MPTEGRVKELTENEKQEAASKAKGQKTKNLYNKMELAGRLSATFGTLIPFVVAYITIVKVPPSASFYVRYG